MHTNYQSHDNFKILFVTRNKDFAKMVENILDDFTTPTYLPGPVSFDSHPLNKKHPRASSQTRLGTTTVIQKSHKPVVWLTDEITGRGQGCRSFLFSFFPRLIVFARNRLETKKLPHPLTQTRFARFRNINCALPVKRILSLSLFSAENYRPREAFCVI